MTPAGGTSVVVVGGGVIGLACAAALARSGFPTTLIEQHKGFGRETTSRNSEVIHAGLYYPPDSLKARFCVEGRERLYSRCRSDGVAHRRLGKVIVACDEAERMALDAIATRGRAAGAGALEWLSSEELRQRVAGVRGVAALWSPESGIVDGGALCLSLAAEVERHEGVLALCHRLVEIAGTSPWRLVIEGSDGARDTVECGVVINAAGLHADRVAEMAGLDVDALGLRLHWCKGDYFSLAPGATPPLRHLVYPLPSEAGLGIHATLDLGGRVRFGPDTEYVDQLRYDVDAAKTTPFAEAIRRYWPTLRAEDLSPDYAGIRPKLAGPGEGFRDFVVREESANGAPGFVNLVGIESPGLTAALAIAEEVVHLLR